MKTFHGVVAVLLILISLSACDNYVAVDTVVHEDGSLDRTIILSRVDSVKALQNFFGASAANGWDLTFEEREKTSGKKDSVNNKEKTFDVTFKKHFGSAEASNAALNNNTDSLFHIETTFDKQFRWFYTYITYTETYKAIDRFKYVSSTDYFTPEEHAFINRLPAEGKPVSKSDSLFLTQLNSKIFDTYATRGLFEEYFQGFLKLLRENNAEQRWTDTLVRHKEKLFKALVSDKVDGPDDKLMLSMAESIGVPVPTNVREAYARFNEAQERQLNFMSEASSGKYTHTIHMPWPVMSSNGDSVVGNTVVWQPPVTKFLISDHTFSAQARKMNYWTIIVSVIFVAGSIWLVRRRSKS